MIDKNVSLWLGSYSFPVHIRVSQFDTMWRFIFDIVENSQPWEIPSGATAILNGKKPDGNVFAFSGTIEDNTVSVDCDVQMTAVAGQTICELSILSDGKVVGTANFTLDVEAAPKSPDDVSSDSTLPAYAEMLEMFSGDIEDEVDSWLNAHSSQIGGLTNEAKQALLTLLAHVAYTDDQGQTYLDALETALYPPVDLVSISAVFTQGSAVIYDTDDLDTLKQYLTVTANYSDSTTETVTAYTLSGTLTVGTSTITVSYGGKTDTFTVTVSEAPPSYLIGYTEVGSPSISNNILSVTEGNFIKTQEAFSPGNSTWKITCKARLTSSVSGSGYADLFGGVDASNASTRSVLLECSNATFTNGSGFISSNNTSWNIMTSSSGGSTFPTALNTWVWYEVGYDGTNYTVKASTDGVNFTTAQTATSVNKVYGGFAVGFGMKRNGVWRGDIDLTECKIYIGDALWWAAAQ